MKTSKSKNAQASEQPPFLDSYAPYLINRISSLLQVDIKNSLRELKLTVPRWRILASLIENEGMNIGELSVKVAMDHASTSRVIEQMKKGNLITCEVSRHDGRYTHVFLTDKGRKVFSIMKPKAINQEQKLLSNLTEKETKDFFKIMNKMLENIEISHYLRH